jgi:phosphoglycerate dehydrogenase-like enzyme
MLPPNGVGVGAATMRQVQQQMSALKAGKCDWRRQRRAGKTLGIYGYGGSGASSRVTARRSG